MTHDDAWPSVASAGSHSEPIAWMVRAPGIGSIMPVCHSESEAVRACRSLSDVFAEVVPLYETPTLTVEERQAIESAADAFEASSSPVQNRRADTLRGLLKRLK